MTRKLLTMAGTAVLALAYAPLSHAAIATELVLDDGVGDVATIDESTTGVLTCTDTSATGACAGLVPGSEVFSSGPHKTISILSGTIGQFTLDVTGKGQKSNTLPTLQVFNQVDATSSGAGTLTATFTDTSYSTMNSVLDIADSNTTDQQIQTSTIQFNVYTDAANNVPATTLVGTNILTGHSSAGGGLAANPNFPNGSLTSQAILTFTGVGNIQANITVANVLVPEPASVVFLGTMVVGLSAFLRKKAVKRP
jgi:hypothetical protein